MSEHPAVRMRRTKVLMEWLAAAIWLYTFMMALDQHFRALLVFLVIDTILVAIIFLFRHRIRLVESRPAAGLCPTCGYDLRASKDRCPECGRSIERKP